MKISLPSTAMLAALAAQPLCAAPSDEPMTLPNEEQNKAQVAKSIEANYEDAKALKDRFVDYLGIDPSELHAVISDHVRMVVPTDEATAQMLVQLSEYCYRRLNWATFGKLDAETFKNKGGRQCYYRVGKDSYADMVSLLSEVHPQAISRAAVRSILQDSHTNGGITMAGLNPPMELSKNGGEIASWAANGMGFSWVLQHCLPAMREVNLKSGQRMGVGSGGRGRGHLMTWLEVGVGVWSSVDAIGTNSMSRFTKSIYANSGKRRNARDNDYIAMVYELAAGKVSRKIATKNFYQVTTAGLNDLTDLDTAMAWSVVDFMLSERNESWRTLIQACGRYNNFRYPFVLAFGSDQQKQLAAQAMKEKNDRGLSDVYRTVCTSFEGDWRKWAKKRWSAAYKDPSKGMMDTPFQPVTQGGEAEEEDDGDKKKKKRRRRRR